MIRHIRTVYLAGPMRGYANYNFPAFDAAAERLRDLGYRVLSPADIDRENGFDPVLNPDVPFDEEGMLPLCIKRDVESILESDAVVLLEGWSKSTGAQTEVSVAMWAHKHVYEMGDFLTEHFIMQEQYA